MWKTLLSDKSVV